jgi:hypothetical protein
MTGSAEDETEKLASRRYSIEREREREGRSEEGRRQERRREDKRRQEEMVGGGRLLISVNLHKR